MDENCGEKRSGSGYTTRRSQLESLSAGEDAAWKEFYRKYRAMILAIGERQHLSAPDCEDLMQDVVRICFQKLRDFVYDPEVCRFRTFLFKVAQNVAMNIRRKNERGASKKAGSAEYDVPELDLKFMREYEDFLLEKSFDILRRSVDSETYLAFELLTVQERPVPEVVRITGKTAGAIYTLKHRCMKKLRAIIDDLDRQLEIQLETDRPAERRKVLRP